ncbi:hypothetical protein [Halomonas sp. BM-2019]|uniref:hypothetical protein n=1 Tax=Halomonas sp. BM-2019 TaxID=2811227 RepID=UPI001B3C401F|nr:MAG: hypothetical protein J5F18_12390 [Halomonas sp. BM-2019]
MDEREKLRKFRELDDAFAEALRELDRPDCQLEIPTGPPMAPLAEEVEQDEATRQQRFEERLRALMQEYHQPAEQVARLLQALKKMGRIA